MRLATAIRLGSISLIALGLCSFQTIRAAESDDHPAKTVEKPLRIERRLVPAGRPEDWPRDANQPYLPIAAEEFERRLAALNGESSAETSTPRPASLTSGEYHAELTRRRRSARRCRLGIRTSQSTEGACAAGRLPIGNRRMSLAACP